MSTDLAQQPTDTDTDIAHEMLYNRIKIIDNTSTMWGTMLTLQDNLNLRIGTQIWKKYINAAFWNYISTPINFTITLFTAMSAGQTGTQSNYLTKDQLFYILFVSFILSIINTFFKLKDKAIMNYDSLKKYQDFGAEFERIYFTNICNEAGLQRRYNNYLELQDKLNTFESTGSIEQVNYVTELIYLCIKCCFHDRLKRVVLRERFWVLDGRPKKDYPHNFYVNLKKQYRHNFDIEEGISFNGDVTIKDRKHNPLAIDMSDPSSNVSVSPHIFLANIDNDKYNERGSRFKDSNHVSKAVKENTWSDEEEDIIFDIKLVERLREFLDHETDEYQLIQHLAKEQYDVLLTEDTIQDHLEHLKVETLVAEKMAIRFINRICDVIDPPKTAMPLPPSPRRSVSPFAMINKKTKTVAAQGFRPIGHGKPSKTNKK
jgi:hypothetical protein